MTEQTMNNPETKYKNNEQIMLQRSKNIPTYDQIHPYAYISNLETKHN